jgi:hypothetical protein
MHTGPDGQPNHNHRFLRNGVFGGASGDLGGGTTALVKKKKKRKDKRRISTLLKGEHPSGFQYKIKRRAAAAAAAGGGGGGGDPVLPINRKRGLTGMSLLAQAAAADPEFEDEFLGQTVDEYEANHPNRTASSSSSEDEDDDGDDDDDDEEDVDQQDSDDDDDDGGGGDGSSRKKHRSSAPVTFNFKTYSEPPSHVEKGELLVLRQQVQVANNTITELREQLEETEKKAVETREERDRAINQCERLQEMNEQLKVEHHRMVLFSTQRPQQAPGQNPALNGMNGIVPNIVQSQQQVQQQQQHHQQQQQQQQQHVQHQHQHQQDQILIEVLQARLKEAEIRYHQVTESLSRQTGVLSDQHRAILELNGKLEGERAKRQALEIELEQLKRR